MVGLRMTVPTSACAVRSAAIIERLKQLPILKTAAQIALFWPILAKHEVDLRELDTLLRARGATIAYPYIAETESISDDAPMDFRLLSDVGDLESSSLGFLQPPADAPIADSLDAIIVPALAIDPFGHRIGYGAGYYDCALREVTSQIPSCVTIGVAYDYQLISEVPVTPGDIAVAWIVTDSRVMQAGGST